MIRPIFRRTALIAFAALAQPAGMSAAAAPSSADVPAVQPWTVHVADAARRFDIPEDWIWAVIRVESAGDPRAVSPAGAMGLMQLMPATWTTMRARYGLGIDPFEPHDNIVAGAAFLRVLHDRYGGPAAMLAAYNAGSARYDDYVQHGRPLPPETVAYLARFGSVTGSATVMDRAGLSPPDPLAWTRAALFAAQPARTAAAAPDAGTAPSDTQPDRRENDRSPATLAVTEPLATGLFVATDRRPDR